MSDLSETDTESYVRDRDSTSYYYKIYNVIIMDSIIRDREEGIWPKTALQVWGAVCKATQYEVLHHFFG